MDKFESGTVWKLGYFGYFPKTVDNHYREDHRIRGSLNWRFSFYNLQIMHRSRVEYRMGQIPSGFRYRPTLDISKPLSFRGIAFTPFVQGEPFYDFRQHEITLSLVTAGIKVPINKNVSLKVGHFNIFLYHPSKHSQGALISVNVNL